MNQPHAGHEHAVADEPHLLADYGVIQSAIEFLTKNWEEHPTLDDLSGALGLSPAHTQKLFKRWCGLSPKEFLQAITIDHARQMLEGSASVLETALSVGLSGTGRLHDLFVDHEAMTPGEFKRRGAGLTIEYGFHASPFGLALIMTTPRGIAGLAFADGTDAIAKHNVLSDMMRRWPAASYVEAPHRTAAEAIRVFARPTAEGAAPLRLVLIGTDFDIKVWKALLKIPVGRAITYSDIASNVGSPDAQRAVGSAVGRNPISFVVPCHRALRKDGGLGGYHWGITRKRAIIGWEKGFVVASKQAS